MRALAFALSLALAGPAWAACPELDRIAAERSGQVVEMPELLFLHLIWIEAEAGGTYAIASFGPLPNGGIGGRDICREVQLIPFDGGTGEPRAGDPAADHHWERMTQATALLLDFDAPLADRYTEAMVEASERDQLSLQPAGQIRVHAFAEGEVPKSSSAAFRTLLRGAGNCRRVAVVTDRSVLVPLCPAGAS